MFGCKSKTPKAEAVNNDCPELNIAALPDWAHNNANIYEVNVRQFSPEGTFAAVQNELPRLRAMGIDILWLMPVQPIGELRRKGSLGSYYSIRDYKALNPEFGTEEDFTAFMDQAHSLGFKVILDWVANHTSFDHVWIAEHPDWYTTNEKGEIISPVDDWADVADLNYDKSEMREAMIDAMAYWVKTFGMDGFRCDVAEMVPDNFWLKATTELNKIKPLFMLAEAEGMNFYESFNATYGWELHHIMNKIAAKKEDVGAIDAYLNKQKEEGYTDNHLRMYFTSNHDENSWNGTEFERMGNLHQAFFAVGAFMQNGIPLVYTGQEAAFNRRLAFFEKDSIDWGNFELNDFYTQILKLKNTHPATSNGCPTGNFIRLETGNNPYAYAYMRSVDDKSIVVIANLGDKAIEIPGIEVLRGEWKQLFNEKPKAYDGKKSIKLEAGEFVVWSKQ
jgi:glycosidase